MPPRGLEDIETAPQIQPQNPFQIGASIVEQSPANVDRRRADCDVKPLMFIHKAQEDVGDCCRIGDIQSQRFSLSSLLADCRRSSLGTWTIDISADRESPCRCNPLCGGPTYSGGRTSNESDAAIKPKQ